MNPSVNPLDRGTPGQARLGRWGALVLGALAIAGAVAGCGGADEGGQRRAAAPVSSVTPAPADPGPRRPPRRLDPAPPPGAALVEPGPFTDRVKIVGLAVTRGQRPLLKGGLIARTDVSELLALTVRADFYDRRGRYLASGTRTYGEHPEFFDKALSFSVQATRPAPKATAALLSIPDLVNE